MSDAHVAPFCAGKDTTSIVKASDFLSFQDVTHALLLHGVLGVRQETMRYICRAFWRFLELVYLATDTESTRKDVRATNNRIWLPDTQRLHSEASSIPLSETSVPLNWDLEQISEGGTCRCLIEVVVDELSCSENDPKDALLNR